jgi:hypothetical protein
MRKPISRQAHGLAPWVFGFSRHTRARNTFLGIGLLASAVILLTRPEEQPSPSS